MLRTLLTTWILLGTAFQLLAQSFGIGLNPPSMRWNQINTNKVQVIFPLALDKEAQRVANLVHYLYDSSTVSIGDQSDKVTIIIQNQNTVANSLVTPRLEFVNC